MSHSTELRLAHAPHECQGCHRTIDPGESYVIHHGQDEDDGCPYHVTSCGHCELYRPLWVAATGCREWCYDELTSQLGACQRVDAEPGHPDALRWFRALQWLERGWRHDDGTLVDYAQAGLQP